MNRNHRKSVAIVLTLLLVLSLPMGVLAAEYYIDEGSIEITDTHVNQAGKDSATHDGNVTVTQKDSSTATSNTVTVKTENSDVNVVLKDVNIEAGSGAGVTADRGAGTTVTVELDGKNTVSGAVGSAGVETKGEGDLVIQDKDDNGSLTAVGGHLGAGIGGSADQAGTNITINGGTIDAQGSDFGAGIGGGSNGSAANITVNDGNVTAVGGAAGGAGIGTGRDGIGGSVTSENITITGGTVTASGGGAGIGGGNATGIQISGGTVTAEGREGAGIGGGNMGVGDEIVISGGTVDAKSVDKGSGIGSGMGAKGGSIVIEKDAQVTAKGNTVTYMGPVESESQDIGSGQNAEHVDYDTTGLYTSGSVNGVAGTVEPPVEETPAQKSQGGQGQSVSTRYSRGSLVTNTGTVKKVLFAFGEDWEETLEDGVLTITAPKDAKLEITVYAMNVLKGRGIQQIVFGGKTLVLKDLVKGHGALETYALSGGKLTLDGKEV